MCYHSLQGPSEMVLFVDISLKTFWFTIMSILLLNLPIIANQFTDKSHPFLYLNSATPPPPLTYYTPDS